MFWNFIIFEFYNHSQIQIEILELFTQSCYSSIKTYIHCLIIIKLLGRGFQDGLLHMKHSCTSNRPRATGKILLTTCKAWSGSERKGNQQRAKVTNTVTAILTNRKSLHEESRTETRWLRLRGRPVKTHNKYIHYTNHRNTDTGMQLN